MDISLLIKLIFIQNITYNDACGEEKASVSTSMNNSVR